MVGKNELIFLAIDEARHIDLRIDPRETILAKGKLARRAVIES